MEYFEAMRLFSRTMFRIVALSLGLQEKYFDEFAYGRDSKSSLSSHQHAVCLHTNRPTTAVTMCRAHRYPPTTPEMAEKSRGIGAHTDFGALTLLLQDDSKFFKADIEIQHANECSRWLGSLSQTNTDMAPSEPGQGCICRQYRRHVG